jgi:hypothetical protein
VVYLGLDARHLTESTCDSLERKEALMPDWAVVLVIAVMASLAFLVARALLRR